jgi:hypothetical protein
LPTERPNRRLTTILAADVAGYSRLTSGDDGPAAVAASTIYTLWPGAISTAAPTPAGPVDIEPKNNGYVRARPPGSRMPAVR